MRLKLISWLGAIVSVFILSGGLLNLQSYSPQIGRRGADLPLNPITPLNNPPSQQIAYLVAEGAVGRGSQMAPANVQTALGAKIVNTWDQFKAADAASSFEAVIIHQSAVSLVDKTWVAAAYRRGVAISTFNIPIELVAQLVDDPCITGERSASEVGPDPFFIVTNYYVFAENPVDQALVEAAYLETCNMGAAEGITGYVITGQTVIGYPLANVNQFNYFTRHLDTVLSDFSESQSSVAPAND